jgi:hypothetical protein
MIRISAAICVERAPARELLNRDLEVAPTRHFFGSGSSGLGSAKLS